MKYRDGTYGEGFTWYKQNAKVNGEDKNGYHLYLEYRAVQSENKRITFKYIPQNQIRDNEDNLKGEKDTVKYTVNLLDTNGNLTPITPVGTGIPETYTSESDVMDISELISQISVDGYTLDDGYAFFFWSGNQSVTQGINLDRAGAHKVLKFKNFTRVSDDYGDGSSRFGDTTTTGTYHTIGYIMTQLNGEAYRGDDWNTDTEGYWAYEYGGALHVVLKPVSEQDAFKTRFYNYAESGSNKIIDTTNCHHMIYSGNRWQGNLTMTNISINELTSPGNGYVFSGWYDNCDENGNGTGTKITGNELQYSDKTVYARWEANYETEEVNFYLNLSSTILDYEGNLSSHNKNLFTTSVSGPATATHTDDGRGIGKPLNEDLQVIVPEGHDCVENGEIYVISSTSGANARAVDEKITQLGDKGGTNGNQQGHINEIYQIVDGEGNPAFPSDGEIFEYIKENWGKEPNDPDGTANNVNKGQNIEVNGNPIKIQYLDEEHFLIRWYVFKENSTDKWHVDGILVPKSGILNVTKTFPNEEVVDAINDEGDFRINVTGNFLAGTTEEPNTNISLQLPTESTDGSLNEPSGVEVDKKENEDGSVTYTWTLAIFGAEYTVAENGYDISGEWIYNSTDCTYTNVDGETTTPNNLTTGNGTISATIHTVCNWQDTDTQKGQTLNFINYYNTDNEDDKPYILVKKTFKGLSFKQIEGLYDDFTLTVTNTSDSSDEKVLRLSDYNNVTVSPESTDKDKIQDYTFTWKVEDCTTGTYMVTKEGETVGRYDVTTEGTGDEVEVSEETWRFDPDVKTITANNETSFMMGAGKIVLATLKANGGYLIWTNEQLSITQREAIIEAINDLDELKTFKNGDATLSNC